MKTQGLSIVALAGVAAATNGGWGSGGSSYQCPGNTNNTCSSEQQQGFSWDSYSVGQSIGSYGGLNFQGWSCGSWAGVGGKRDGSSKCATGVASSNKGGSASIGCGSGTSGFSVDHLIVAPEVDCDLEFEYGMPGGSTCKQTASCSQRFNCQEQPVRWCYRSDCELPDSDPRVTWCRKIQLLHQCQQYWIQLRSCIQHCSCIEQSHFSLQQACDYQL